VIRSYLGRAKELAEAGQDEESMEQLRRALAIEPDNPQTRLQLSAALYRAGQYGPALKEAELASRLAPGWSEPPRFRSKSLGKLGHPELALDAAQAAVKLDPEGILALHNLALVQLAAGLTAEAENTGEHMLRRHPGDFRSHLLLGQIAYVRGEMIAAQRNFREALAIEPGSATARMLLGGALREDAELGIVLMFEAAKDDPSLGEALGWGPEAMPWVGWALERQGRSAEAEQAYRQGIEAKDAFAANIAALRLAVLLHEQGRNEEAERRLRKAARAGYVPAIYLMAKLLHHLGRGGEMWAWYRLAARAGDVLAAYALGILLRDKGDSPEAERWLRRAAEAGEADAAFELGRLLATLGRRRGAMRWYERAAWAGKAEAAEALADMHGVFTAEVWDQLAADIRRRQAGT
jgi:tetratricopeptide (TPR) repeat protein